MTSSMYHHYHFKPTEHAPETTVLNEHTELSGRAIKFLKDFQISAVRFLFEKFCQREFCILNDESGLGKTASVSVFLGIVAVKKKCLIVVSNNDECITNWRFHLDILTDLKVSVLNEEIDFNATAFCVYIVKWNTLHAISDLSKLNFDLVVLDNREQMLNNTFCISTLLKNFEKKVHLVISSVDVTSDIKLMHNILRLGGHLEHKFEIFKAFEQKFKLPDLKEISAKKSDLEDYFLKREILSDYCKEFRLRRYRHQFLNCLPLVEPTCYKAFLKEWLEKSNEEISKAALLIGDALPCETSTEELLQQYQTNPESIYIEKSQMTNTDNNVSLKADNERAENLITPAAIDVTDDLMDMPPLLLSDSDNEVEKEEDVIFLSSESVETVARAMQVIEIEDEVVAERQQLKNKNDKKSISTPKNQKAELNKEVNKDVKSKKQNHNHEKPTTRNQSKQKKEEKTITAPLRKLRTTQIKSNIKAKKQLKENTAEIVKIKNEKTTPKKQQETAQSIVTTQEKLTQNLGLRLESPMKKIMKDNKAKTTKTTTPKASAVKINPKALGCTLAEIETNNEDCNFSTAKQTPTSAARRGRKKKEETFLKGAPNRETRNMQRSTRSMGGKRKCFALDFDDEKRVKTKVKPKKLLNSLAEKSNEKIESKISTQHTTNEPTPQSQKPKPNKAEHNNKNKRKSMPTRKIPTTTSKTQTNSNTSTTKTPTTKTTTTTLTKLKSATRKSMPARKIPQTTLTKTKTKSAINKTALQTTTTTTKSAATNYSTQSFSVLPTSSEEYEEIQCGQKLIYSSNDNSPQLIGKCNEFLMPAIPQPQPSTLTQLTPTPLFHTSQYSLLQQPAASLRVTSLHHDSDVVAIIPTTSKNNNNNKNAAINTIIVLSSSQDETSLSSQTSSTMLATSTEQRKTIGTPRRKRYSKRMMSVLHKKPKTFGDLLAKQRVVNCKSPDLFGSIGSDAGIMLTQNSSNIALPFAQPNNRNTLVSSPSPTATTITTTTPTTTPTFGFKIFGSEVRSFQQTSMSAATTSKMSSTDQIQRPLRAGRSCLNLLEQMFDKNTNMNTEQNTTTNETEIKINKNNVKELRTLRTANRANKQETSANAINTNKHVTTRTHPLDNKDVVSLSSQSKQPNSRRKTMHECQKFKAVGFGDAGDVGDGDSTLLETADDDIFEITNNATFGSTLRITPNGRISPVQQFTTTTINNNQHQNHNKITNYLIGNCTGNGTINSIAKNTTTSNINNDEQMFTTPSKRLRQQQQQQQQSLPGSGGSGNGAAVVILTQNRKSPKSVKSIQTTKLTKWFRRSSSIDDNGTRNKVNKDNENSKSAKLVKRRRLDLSLKS